MHHKDAAYEQRLLISVILVCMQASALIKPRRILLPALVFLVGPVFFAVTDPNRLPLPLVVIPFIWLFVVLYMSINFVMRWRWPEGARKRRVIAAGVGAALPVLLLVFESIHQLTIKDFLLSVALVACVSFYMAKADFIR